MSKINNSTFYDARQLFEAFTQSSWRHLEIDHRQMRLSITRFSADEREVFTRQSKSELKMKEVVHFEVIRAPHISTLVALAPVGVALQPGDTYGTIKVLDEYIELKSNGAVKIVGHAAIPGDVLEYFSPIVEVAPFGN